MASVVNEDKVRPKPLETAGYVTVAPSFIFVYVAKVDLPPLKQSFFLKRYHTIAVSKVWFFCVKIKRIYSRKVVPENLL